MNIKQNLFDLIKDAHFYQYAGIVDTKEELKIKKPRLYFSKIQWFFILFSIFFNFILSKGFSENFAGYIISGLSLFVGLFFTFILMIFDKFQSIDFTKYRYSQSMENYPIGVRLKNYFKKITVLSLYTIILSIVLIILLSMTLLFKDFVNSPICLIDFVTNIKLHPPKLILKTFVLLSYRSLIVYFLLDFILITLYLISSFYDFMISEYNNVKLK